MFAGLLTSVSVSVLGVVLAVAGCVGWFREVLPHEHEETMRVVFEETSHNDGPPRCRTSFPLLQISSVRGFLSRTYPVSAGIKGGLAGGIAMAVLACTYGLLKAGKHLVSHQLACRYCLRGIA